MLRTVTKEDLQRIASLCSNRWDYHYTRSKLGTDPVYAAVAAELSANDLPVLDIGCGMGLLAHYLRAAGSIQAVHGFDFDERKIRSANEMATRSGLQDAQFHCGDARSGLPDFRGNVVILDVLQYLDPAGQKSLLNQCAAQVADGGRLIIRTGLKDESWRYKVTVTGDWIAKVSRWMKAAPVSYPTAEGLAVVMAQNRLRTRVTPLWGRTPFNNHLVVADRIACTG